MFYWIKRFKKLSKIKKFFVVVVLLSFIVLLGGLGFWFGRSYIEKSLQKVFSPLGTLLTGKPKEARDVPDPLNGVLYTQTEANRWKNRLPLAVVIENHTDARPQTGMAKAEITYEALAEGGITRTLNIYLAPDTQLGPVRSNRPYFLDWLSEYKAGYAHIGGSPEAQAKVRQYGIKDLDQFGLGAPTYERVTFRFAPHNVYTTTTKLRAAAAKKGYTGPVSIESWLFKDKEAEPEERPKKFSLKVKFGSSYSIGSYDVDWIYDPKTNLYLRKNGGLVHTDAATKKQLTAKNIIVEYVPTQLAVSGGHGRLHMSTIGKGKVKIFTDGKVFTGTWKKSSREGRTRFYDKRNKEIELNRGKIWIEIVPVGSSVSFK
ncbi:MAG: DUF3048 domain-containing protein [bacterium]|nr:DUF3048 domain-containing protein [bacterium]